MAKEEIDIDEEILRISRKTNYKMKKSEYSFDKQIKKLDNEIDNLMNDKIKQFDEIKKPTDDYLSMEFSHDTVDRYREKLRKM
jgi:phage host-nuclease inhibitor protein Gam